MQISYANVTATLALFIALGGTSYAVTKLPANSVGTPQLRKDAVNGTKIADATVDLTDLTPAARGARGPRGEIGPAGAAGAAGAPGLSHMIVRRRATPGFLGFGADQSVTLVTMQVPAGKWFVQAVTNAISTRESAYFRAYLSVDGVVAIGGMAVGVGGTAGGAFGALLAPSTVVDTATPRTVTLTCLKETAVTVSSDQPRCERTTLTATRVNTLDVADVTG